jgi:hypothetical protein
MLYLSTHKRLDISFTVGMLGRAMAAPSAQDVVAVKRLMRYLSGTRDYGLVLGGTGDSKLVAYSDADWGGDIDRKSTSGALQFSAMILSTGRARIRAASLCPPRRKNMRLLRVVPRMQNGFVVSCLISTTSRRTPQSS